jgi:hypothetical protein
MNNYEDVVDKALQLLEAKTGLKGRWYANATDKNTAGKLELRQGATKVTVPAIYKKDVKAVQLVPLQQLKETYPDLMVIAEVIYPAIREQLRQIAVNYIDASGNCYIRKNDWVILVEGFKTATPKLQRKERAFTKTGVMLLFHFLNDENYLNVTYRQMAEDYNIALGNVNYIINSLKEQDYLIRVGKKKLRLTRKPALLAEWITAYEQKLKPALNMGNFRFLNGFDADWKKLPLKNNETQWGGEPAANLLTNYLQPAKLTLYTLENKIDLIKKYKLVPDEKGNLGIFRRFWKFGQTNDEAVPPILVYADLINTNDTRNLDTARKIYDGLLKDQF